MKMKRLLKMFCYISLTLVLASCASDLNQESKALYDIQFHRGARAARSENTLYAYQYAIENGATTIECDLQMTKDGILVMSHNPALNPDLTTDENGKRIERSDLYINTLSLEELKTYNVGQMDPTSEYYALHGITQIQADAEIPTLKELFDLVKVSNNEKIRLNIEIKSYPDPALGMNYEKASDPFKMLEAFYELVQEYEFEERVILQSFDWAVLKKMEEMNPKIETCALFNETEDWSTPEAKTLWLEKDEASPWLGGLNIHDFEGNPVLAAHSLGIDAISPYYGIITKELVDQAHELDMEVIAWTVNQLEDMENLYKMGVDGMISDKAWLLRDFIESKGETLLPKQAVNAPYHLDQDHNEVEVGPIEGGKDASH